MHKTITILPAGPDVTRFQDHQFDVNLGEAPLLQKPAMQDSQIGGPKGWREVTKDFLTKAKNALQSSNS